MKVDFIIVGAQKCGTTTLFHMLNMHPHLVGSRPKELHFFGNHPDWENKIDYYHSFFAKQENCRYFEASTSYTNYSQGKPELWKDMYKYNPELKIIYIVRNPMERIVSDYMHLYRRRYTDSDIEKCLYKNKSVINRSRYYFQIKPFVDTFGRYNVHICFLEDLISSPDEFTKKLMMFLDIDLHDSSFIKPAHKNQSTGVLLRNHKYDSPGKILRILKYILPAYLWKKLTHDNSRVFMEKPLLPVQTMEKIINELEPDIYNLEILTGRDLSTWRKTTIELFQC